ncbi:MAG: AAA-associated domain-containing protein [Candidatus Acetothermia bacterium]|jgi:NitT/TauT family transport system ATP-binding protein|nr:AAA-associated domain-containing protein [Candidatus Acetothermia bacterium]MDH7505623.1 AAA-associated domain-containing protein [Candidatus Acetothermia bacterium]
MEDKVDPLPNTGVNRIFGLLELLDDRGGREDIYRLADELGYELGELLAVIQAAELLGFLETPGGDVLLLPLGKRAIEGDTNLKKALFKEQLRRLGLFRHLSDYLQAREGQAASREEILEELAHLLPQEDPEQLFETLLNWGRYGELFGYDPDEDRFYLDQLWVSGPARPGGLD